jgi:hypothetical protein
LGGWHVPAHKEKVFFSEEKKQKTFIMGRLRSPGPSRQRPKVFWFFFSKKNKPFFSSLRATASASAARTTGSA